MRMSADISVVCCNDFSHGGNHAGNLFVYYE